LRRDIGTRIWTTITALGAALLLSASAATRRKAGAGDFYTKGPNGEQGVQPFSMAKALDEKPEYVVFNGSVRSTVDDKAITAKALLGCSRRDRKTPPATRATRMPLAPVAAG
jgi:hypothetical protein